MIGRLMNGGANDVLVVALSGTIAVLVANGPGRASLGRVLSGVLSNPVPRRETSAARVLSPTGAERRTAA
jgi:hypothetical protein